MAVDSCDIAWAAGFFDGEGCIRIAKRDKVFQLLIGVSQKVRAPIEDFVAIMGIGTVKTFNYTNGGFEVRYCGSKAVEVLKIMRPHLRLKAVEADLAIEFQNLLHPGDWQPIDPSNFIRREQLYEEMRNIKQSPDRGRIEVLV